MPAPSPTVGKTAAKALRELGARVRSRRKQLGLSAIATAEAAGMSRVTLHRIEKGEPSVAMGAYMSALDALGLALEARDRHEHQRVTDAAAKALPRAIRPAEYPQLKKLAWQLREGQELTPEEALNLYERNWRHVETARMSARERGLLELLSKALGRERLLVPT
jgi:transcriptional regulator with XRE-family HTH domain